MITACTHKTQNGSNCKKPNGRPIKPVQRSHNFSFQEDEISTEITQYPSDTSQHLSPLYDAQIGLLAQTSLGAVLPLPLASIWRNEISVKEGVLIRIKVHKGIGARVTACVLFLYHQFSSTHSVKYTYFLRHHQVHYTACQCCMWHIHRTSAVNFFICQRGCY